MTFTGLVGPFAAILAVSGLTKLARPTSIRAALDALGLRTGPSAGVLVGSSEVGLAALVLTVGGPWVNATAAVWFCALTAVSILLARRHSDVPCGCFGDGSSPPGVVHVAANACGAALFALATASASPSLVALVADDPLGGAFVGAQVAVGAWMLLAVYRDLPAGGTRTGPLRDFELVERR